jgi:hypothetical protein
MAYNQQKANAYNAAVRSGVDPEQALRDAGISEADLGNYELNDVPGDPNAGTIGKFSIAGTNPNIGIPAGNGTFYSSPEAIEAEKFLADPPPSTSSGGAYRTTTSTVTSTNVTETGGGSRTTTVTPTTYRDSDAGSTYRTQATDLQAQKDSYAQQLRAEGKSGAEIMRDPTYRSLSSQQRDANIRADSLQVVDKKGTVNTATDDRPDTNTTTTTYEVATGTAKPTSDDPDATTQDLNNIQDSKVDADGNIVTSDPATAGGGFVYDSNGELVPADSQSAIDAQAIDNRVENSAPAPMGGNYTQNFNAETGQWDVVNTDTGEVVQSGLSQQDSELAAQNLSVGDGGYPQLASAVGPTGSTAFDDQGNLNPGWALDENNNPVYLGGNTVDPATLGQAEADRNAALQAQLKSAQNQKSVQEQRKKVNEQDWRVRLRLSPQATYLYKDPQVDILAPLALTDGVVFPYTPKIDMTYMANYAQEALTHSNYYNYFYQGSYVQAIQLTGTFTAQDTEEANYMLAVIHFLRSCTKMFYGQDLESGSPPPLLYLTGLGTYQFNEHSCVVQQFNYNLPNDIDYIRAGSRIGGYDPSQENFNKDRVQSSSVGQRILSGIAGAVGGPLARLTNSGLKKGAEPAMSAFVGSNVTISKPTYVPTRLDVTLNLLPVQSRQQVSQTFSLKGYSNGDLLRKGFW